MNRNIENISARGLVLLMLIFGLKQPRAMHQFKCFFIIILSFVVQQAQANEDAQQLIEKVVAANGGIEQLKSLKDVSFEYTFRSEKKGIVDKSIERYIFEGEISYAQYTDRQYFVLPDLKGTHTQYFNGKETISKIEETVIADQQPAYIGHFFRKTNFYWFNMMFKLLDPGVNLRLLPERKVEGQNYKIVEMTFGEKVGDTNDKYILYINPNTYRVNQFLFTVVGFGFTEPFLMQLEYEIINDLYISTYRKYAPANWEGEIIKEEWNEQITKNVQFNNGYNLGNIQSPFLEQSVHSNIEINKSASDVWKLVSNWNNLNQLVPKIVERTEVKGTGITTNWIIYLKNGSVVKEQMTYFDRKQRMMSYAMTETPMPLRDYLATIQVTTMNENKSMITFSTHFKVEEENRINLLSTFEAFQNTYLSNIEQVLE